MTAARYLAIVVSLLILYMLTGSLFHRSGANSRASPDTPASKIFLPRAEKLYRRLIPEGNLPPTVIDQSSDIFCIQFGLNGQERTLQMIFDRNTDALIWLSSSYDAGSLSGQPSAFACSGRPIKTLPDAVALARRYLDQIEPEATSSTARMRLGQQLPATQNWEISLESNGWTYKFNLEETNGELAWLTIRPLAPRLSVSPVPLPKGRKHW